VVVATSILVGVYLLIIFDIVHRTLAAFIGSTATIAALSMLQKRPTFYEVVEWVDLDTISLLFGMMTLVAIFSQTGFFDYSAVKAYKLAKGKIGPLITILCLLSAVVSAFLDNVTTILLLTPVSIRLCQVLNVDPLPVLIAEVVFSNIGGTATAVGDPPNIIIVSNRLIRSQGIDFAEFTLHLSLGILLCMGVAFAVLACIYCTCVRLPNKDRPHIAELKREMAIWERTALQMPVVSLEETAVRDALRTKANEVRNQLCREELLSVQSATDMWQTNLAQLEKQYRITDPVLLVKSASVLVVVILLFFLASVIPGVELELGWIAIFGAVVLLILADTQDLDPILHKIEWSTLLFFAGLFVLMEGLQELGLIQYIGDQMVRMITMVPPENQMVVALILVVWVSALASSFIDNIPFTTATIPVIVELAESPELCLSLRPLVWALAFGACLGGNGTLIGASANVVCAGIAEQNGYKISFVKFFIIGFPMMLATTMTAMIYLLISHEALQWNIDSSCSSS
jgi:Na+/H+ antiporter NhaD/arsenite permease-like protein